MPRGSGKPVLVDGKPYRSVSAAAVALGVSNYLVTQALESGRLVAGSRVTSVPDGYTPVLHHRVDPPLKARSDGMPLIIEPVTHRLGAYRGGSA